MSIHQPIAIVTDANRGIGKEVSRQLAAQGHTVLLTARTLQKAQAAAKELSNSNLIPVQLDVADPASIAALHEQVVQEFGRLDELINKSEGNVVGFSPTASFTTMPSFCHGFSRQNCLTQMQLKPDDWLEYHPLNRWIEPF